jgi:tetratricopeptide (TPR) repeat protein
MGENVMSEKLDPVKIHREGTALYDTGKYKEAAEKFLQAAQLYEKMNNFFDASYALFKAGECNFLLQDFETATEQFLKAADIALQKGFDRFGVSALEYALDCYKETGKKRKATALEKKIKQIKEKLATQF